MAETHPYTTLVDEFRRDFTTSLKAARLAGVTGEHIKALLDGEPAPTPAAEALDRRHDEHVERYLGRGLSKKTLDRVGLEIILGGEW